jgi:glycosyltransferase involved in cell wall biosynthesis
MIAVYGICKNEEKFIERCITSCKDADLIVFGDTGSTDRTKEILLDHGVKVVDLRVMPFRFDSARNSVLSFIPREYTTCISIDGDEVLVAGWRDKLEAVIDPSVDRYYHRFKTVWNWEGAGDNVHDHWHERIHHRSRYVWRSPVHEYLRKVTEGPENIEWLDNSDFMVQLPDLSKDRSSYLDLMRLAIQEEPDQWKIFYFLQQELRSRGILDEARYVYDRMRAMPGVDPRFLDWEQ